MADVFVPIAVFGFVFGIVYVIVSASHREKMAQIEKGIFLPKQEKTRRSSLYLIKYGMLLIGVALGILFGNILTITTVLMKEIAYWSMVCLFGGASLLLSYLIEKKIIEKENKGN